MPVGKEIGKYKGTFNSVRTSAVNASDQVVEGSYRAKTSGGLKGNAVGTMTFSGTPERGMLVDLGTGYLDSGEVTPYKAHGVYWASGKGQWQTRAAVVMGDQTLVVEGEVAMTDSDFTLSGGIFELS